MEKKYLNEETYNKGKKILTIAAIVVLALGILVGGILIKTGMDKANAVDSSENVRSEEELESEKTRINNELIPYKAQQNEEFKTNGFSEEYYRLGVIIDGLQDDLREVESELSKLKMGFYDTSDRIEKSRAIPYYMFGAFIIIASLMGSGALFMTAHRRNIMAFGVQQVMPVVKEGVDEMAPVVGDAVGDVAKKISKGIKEGLKDEDTK